jgi:hypothetical protein
MRMSKSKTWIGLWAASLWLCAAGAAGATTLAFGDTHRQWDGYQNGTGDDALDMIGTPDLTGGVATFDDAGRLTGVRIDYAGRFSPIASGNARVVPGDLFLDLGSDGDWDFVMKLVATSQTPVATYASVPILDVSDLAPSYLMSGSDNAGYWRGYNIRDRHPYAWNGGGEQVGTGSFGPFDQLASAGSLHFDLGLGIQVGPRLTIAFAPSCANDVLIETISAPVPEPTAALVFGVGLLAVARATRKPAGS